MVYEFSLKQVEVLTKKAAVTLSQGFGTGAFCFFLLEEPLRALNAHFP